MELRNDLLIHIASLSVDITIIPHPAAVDTPFVQSFPFFCIVEGCSGAAKQQRPDMPVTEPQCGIS